jgi:hypothetical protein
MFARLTRLNFMADGIYGVMIVGDIKLSTVEHAYLQVDGTYMPKVAKGNYVCKRHPPNRLPYTTFELQSIPDFMGEPVTGILIHVLNFGYESEGCVGVGLATDLDKGMITQSGLAFKNFMALQDGVDEFNLCVE